MLPLRGADGRVLAIGHRGAPVTGSENTLASFRAAVALGVDLVELDVCTLDDGALVVAHSLDLAELTGGRAAGSAAGWPLPRLREERPEVPTLDEALAFFAEEAGDVGAHVDLKAAERAREVAGRIAAHGLAGRAVVTSTDAQALREAAGAVRGLAVGLTYPHDRHRISTRPALAPVVAAGLRAARVAAPARVPGRALAAGAGAAFVHHAIVTPPLVRRLRRRGLAAVAWTVDRPDDVRRVVRAGVDGVVSNDPGMLLATLAT